jgi:dUTP pyrophosphatase
MKVKFKKTSPEAVTPTYAKEGDNGLDLTAILETKNPNYTEYDTGISVEIPTGYFGLVFPRSSISERGLVLANSVGVIDSSYRGSIKLRFIMTPPQPIHRYKVGEKIGQLLIIKSDKIELEETDSLASSERGDKGFGSTNGQK